MSGLPDVLLSIARNPVTAVGLPLTFGMLSGLPTRKVVDGYWYRSLDVPPGRPPKQVFPIAWTLLYAGMGYASHLGVKALDSSLVPSTSEDASLGLKLYYTTLGLNFLWTPLFFMLKQPGWAFLDISALTGTVFYMTAKLHGPTEGKSSYFLVPYCAWLSLATYLNGGIWLRNRNRVLPKID